MKKVVYVTPKALESVSKHIEELMIKVSEIPGNVLGYCDARAITQYLSEYKDILDTAKKEKTK